MALAGDCLRPVEGSQLGQLGERERERAGQTERRAVSAVGSLLFAGHCVGLLLSTSGHKLPQEATRVAQNNWATLGELAAL